MRPLPFTSIFRISFIMSAAILLQKDHNEAIVWLSDSGHSMEVTLNVLPKEAVPGSPLSINMNGRNEVESVKVTDRPLRIREEKGDIEILDLFIFPSSSSGFSIYLGTVSVDNFSVEDGARSAFLVWATWDMRRDEFVIGEQKAKKIIPVGRKEQKELEDALFAKGLKWDGEICASPPKMTSSPSSGRDTPIHVDKAKPTVRVEPNVKSFPCEMKVENERRVEDPSSSAQFYSIPPGQERRWHSGMIVGFSPMERNETVYFVMIRSGTVRLSPRTHTNDSRLRLGVYLKVQLENERPERGLLADVIEYRYENVPESHQIKVLDKDIQIQCVATFEDMRVSVGGDTRWVLYESFLGPLLSPAKGTFKKGDKVRVVVKRTSDSSSSYNFEVNRERCNWTVLSVDSMNPPMDTVYKGMVARVNELMKMIYVICSELPADAVLYDQVVSPSAVIGKWIQFKIHNNPADYAAQRFTVDVFEEIANVFPTRIKSGLPEIQVRCTFTGEMEDECPLLQSEMGPVKDANGIIRSNPSSYGMYDLWLVKHFKEGNSARWKLSVYEKIARKVQESGGRSISSSTTERKMESQDVRSVQKEERKVLEDSGTTSQNSLNTSNRNNISGIDDTEEEVRNLVGQFIFDEKVREAICKYDKEVYDEIVGLCFS